MCRCAPNLVASYKSLHSVDSPAHPPHCSPTFCQNSEAQKPETYFQRAQTFQTKRAKPFLPDMEFVQNFTPPDFQVKNFTPPISPNFNSFSKKKHKKIVKMEKFTPLATNFTLPLAVTAWTNSTSVGWSGLRHLLRSLET